MGRLTGHLLVAAPITIGLASLGIVPLRQWEPVAAWPYQTSMYSLMVVLAFALALLLYLLAYPMLFWLPRKRDTPMPRLMIARAIAFAAPCLMLIDPPIEAPEMPPLSGRLWYAAAFAALLVFCGMVGGVVEEAVKRTGMRASLTIFAGSLFLGAALPIVVVGYGADVGFISFTVAVAVFTLVAFLTTCLGASLAQLVRRPLWIGASTGAAIFVLSIVSSVALKDARAVWLFGLVLSGGAAVMLRSILRGSRPNGPQHPAD